MSSKSTFHLGMALLVFSGVAVALMQRGILLAGSPITQGICFLLGIPLGAAGAIMAVKAVMSSRSR